MGKKPVPVYLNAGDVMTLGIEGLRTQTQQVMGMVIVSAGAGVSVFEGRFKGRAAVVTVRLQASDAT